MNSRYFIALMLPLPLQEAVEVLKQELEQTHGLRGALRSPAHITLHRPFSWPEEKESILLQKLGSFSFGPDFEVTLKDFGFFEPRVIYIHVLPNPALDDLHERLKRFAMRELKLFNEAEDMRGFHPHITIANRDLKKPDFYALQPIYTNRSFGGSFTCSSVSLLKLGHKWRVIQ
mgnify:FL=1